MISDLTIKNCRLYNSPDKTRLVDILIKGKTIAHIGNSPVHSESINSIDTGGRTAVPGFIDIHVQGAGGADVLDGTAESLQTMAKTLARLGTTAFLATTVVNPDNDNRHLKEAASFQGRENDGAAMLGIHLEGPFINVRKRGGISPDSICPPSGKALDDILKITGDKLKMMTIAPELDGNLECIRALTETGIIASFGHSDASYEETKRGLENGISHVTHIFNAMSPLHHRIPGPIPAICETPHVSVQIISDGVHLHPAIVRMIYSLISGERCICITDGVQAAGLPGGIYRYNGREYESKNGTARYPDGTLIGSTLSLITIATRFMEFTGCSFETAVETATVNPARLLRIHDKKGSIDIGKDADIVLLDRNFSVWATLVNGKICYIK